MNYTEAVQLALDGDERGFGFLYENTYKSKLYLSLQYMKNKADAEDVLQDAYVKAFTNLQYLKDPDKFSSWLGQIVANTARNALVKKNPVLFSNVPTEPEEDDSFEEQIEDENVSNQPELSYTREETRQMVQELIDSLSDEQRMCILMYHMEDMPIKDIAAALDCSESTVKSRLNYGRKNLKAKAEEMQKKGYNLYSLAPLALLLLLLHTDAQAMYTEPAFLAAGRQVSNHIFSQIPSFGYGSGSGNTGTGSGTNAGENSGTNSGTDAGTNAGATSGTTSGANSGQAGAANSAAASGAASGAENAAKSGAGKAAAGGFFATKTGQILIGVIGAAVVVGSGFGIATVVRDNTDDSAAKKEGGEVVIVQEPEETTVQEETVEVEPEETVQDQVVSDDMYPDLLEGGLTKSQFEVLLGYVPVPMSNGQVTSDNIESILFNISYDAGFREDISPQSLFGVEATVRRDQGDLEPGISAYYYYDLSEMNNFLSVLMSEPLSNSLLQRGYSDDASISGNTLTVPISDGDWGVRRKATITNAVQSGDTLTVNFHVVSDVYEEVTGTEDLTAVLKRLDDGRYRIDSVS